VAVFNQGKGSTVGERSNETRPSLYEEIDIISAVRKGDIDRLNRLLAKLGEPRPRNERPKADR
jgi:hypothetical protein